MKKNNGIDVSDVSEAHDANSIKIRNIESIVSSYNDRFEVITKLFIKTKSFMEELVNSVIIKKVETINEDIQRIKIIIESHTKELEKFEQRFEEIFKSTNDIDRINKTIESMGVDINKSRDRLIEALDRLSNISIRNQKNEDLFSKYSEKINDLNIKIDTTIKDNKPIKDSIGVVKVSFYLIKILFIFLGIIWTIFQAYLFLVEKNYISIQDIINFFC